MRVLEDTESDRVLDIKAAIEFAQSKGKDLVLMNDKSDIPVCKVMNYKKYIFEQKKRVKQSKAKKPQQVKEVRMTNHIALNDLEVKCKTISRILSAGDKVKVTVTYKGREVRLIDTTLLDKLLSLMDSFEVKFIIDKKPYIDGTKAMMLISPSNKK